MNDVLDYDHFETKIGRWDVHPLAENKPPMYSLMREAIRRTFDPTLMSNIVLYEGMVLDGRTRLSIHLEEIGEPPPERFTEFQGTPEEAQHLIICEVLFRTSLSSSQLAMINVATGKIRYGEGRGIGRGRQKTGVTDQMRDCGVNYVTGRKALQVHRDAPELVGEILKGKMSVV